MKVGDIVRMSESPPNGEDMPYVPLPIHAVVVGKSKMRDTRLALWVHEYRMQGHSCGGRVEHGRGWWANEENLELIEEAQ